VNQSIEAVLRDGLEAEAGTVDVPPDPWAGFTKRERAHRRSRRVRLAVAAVAVAAAVGIQTGIVPLPGWAPGIAVAGRPTALINGPTRGSLAGDTAFLDGLRREIKDVQDPDELWKVGDRSKIKFVYAADVSGRRLGLALVPLRFGFITDWSLIWYEGPAGAPPTEMREGGRGDGGDTVVTYLTGSADERGLALVIAPPGSTISISRGFSYSAAGRVAHDPPAVFPGGLAEFALEPAPFDPGITADVVRDGVTLFNGPLSGGWSGGTSDPQEPTDAVLAQALGSSAFDRTTFQRWVASALHDARLPAAGTAVKLRWTGTVNGAPAALFTLRPRGGGVLAYAFHGSPDSYRQDLRLLLPADGVDRRPIAWRMRAEGKDDRTDQLIVTAPAGAARVTLNVAGSAPVPVTSNAAALAPEATASVSAYAADGGLLGTTPVTPFETNSGGLPGDDLKTRIVE